MSERKHCILGLLLQVAIFVALLATFAACTLEGDIKAVREANSLGNPFLGEWYRTLGDGQLWTFVFNENSYESRVSSDISDRGTYTYSGKKAWLTSSLPSSHISTTAEIVDSTLVVTFQYPSGADIYSFRR